MHLSPVIFEWPYDNEMRSGLDCELVHRAHDIWRHAKNQLDGGTELHCVDCISSLRRAINHRLKSIVNTYQFDLLPSHRAKRQTLERMQEYGLVRPALIKDLLDVRNLIEHEDAPPPDQSRCNYYVDIVWYFLKSTDELVSMATEALIYEEPGDGGVVLLKVSPQRGWTVVVEARIRPELLLAAPVNQARKLEDAPPKRIRGKPGYIEVKAPAILEGTDIQRIAHEYFGAAGYWHGDA